MCVAAAPALAPGLPGSTTNVGAGVATVPPWTIAWSWPSALVCAATSASAASLSSLRTACTASSKASPATGSRATYPCSMAYRRAEANSSSIPSQNPPASAAERRAGSCFMPCPRPESVCRLRNTIQRQAASGALVPALMARPFTQAGVALSVAAPDGKGATPTLPCILRYHHRRAKSGHIAALPLSISASSSDIVAVPCFSRGPE